MRQYINNLEKFQNENITKNDKKEEVMKIFEENNLVKEKQEIREKKELTDSEITTKNEQSVAPITEIVA